MKRPIHIIYIAIALFSGRLFAQRDSVRTRNFQTSVVVDFMGIGYHGYYYPEQMFAITCSGQIVARNNHKLRLFCSAGLGAVPIFPINYATISTGILLGSNSHFFRVGGAFAVAFTKHEAHWDRGYHNGGGGTVYLSWGAQVIPVLGYTYLPSEEGITASLYLSPHYALPTYSAPGPVESQFDVSAGISVGYTFK